MKGNGEEWKERRVERVQSRGRGHGGLASSTATKTQPRQRVQLPTGNGIPLFPGTMIRYVAVWTTHNIAPARDPESHIRSGRVRQKRTRIRYVHALWNIKFKNPYDRNVAGSIVSGWKAGWRKRRSRRSLERNRTPFSRNILYDILERYSLWSTDLVREELFCDYLVGTRENLKHRLCSFNLYIARVIWLLAVASSPSTLHHYSLVERENRKVGKVSNGIARIIDQRFSGHRRWLVALTFRVVFVVSCLSGSCK